MAALTPQNEPKVAEYAGGMLFAVCVFPVAEMLSRQHRSVCTSLHDVHTPLELALTNQIA